MNSSNPGLVYPSARTGTLAYLAPHTQYFLNVTQCKPLWGDAIVAAGVYAMTSNGFVSFAGHLNSEAGRKSRSTNRR